MRRCIIAPDLSVDRLSQFRGKCPIRGHGQRRREGEIRTRLSRRDEQNDTGLSANESRSVASVSQIQAGSSPGASIAVFGGFSIAPPTASRLHHVGKADREHRVR